MRVCSHFGSEDKLGANWGQTEGKLGAVLYDEIDSIFLIHTIFACPARFPACFALCWLSLNLSGIEREGLPLGTHHQGGGLDQNAADWPDPVRTHTRLHLGLL